MGNSMTKTVYINGRFLGKPVTGTQRFAYEIIQALEAQLPEGVKAEILAPQGTPSPQGLKNISFRIVGTHQGHLWEQWDLALASRGGFLLNFVNSGPIIKSRQLVVIHDALVYRFEKNFTLAYRMLHQTVGRILGRRAHLATVSAFSRQELGACLGVAENSISVIANGHEHIGRISADERILEKLGITDRDFFLFIGSPAPNKNLKRAAEAFALLGCSDLRFVIVGAANSNVFQSGIATKMEGLITPGRLTDEEITALYRHARALIFPSLYEGFGIPPLEAMALGCPVLAADIPPVREVCGDAALYFNPLDTSSIAAVMKTFLDTPAQAATQIEKGKSRLALFSWTASAAKLIDLIKGFL